VASTDIIDSWIPIEWDSEVIQRVQRESAIEQLGYRVPMSSATKRVLRSAGLTVTAGTTYTDDTSTNDYITLTARRLIAKFTVDEDDLADAATVVDTIRIKGMDWAISYSDAFDNACIGVSAAENGSTVPFTSAYKALRTTNAATGYTADANYLTWDDDLIAIPASPVGTSLYEKLSTAFKKVETGQFWSQADQFVIAAPGWRDALRLCTDNQGRPIFQPASGATPDTLFGAPITWSRGSKVSATMLAAPGGNDLLLFGNRSYLKKGERSQPSTRPARRTTPTTRPSSSVSAAPSRSRTRVRSPSSSASPTSSRPGPSAGAWWVPPLRSRNTVKEAGPWTTAT
jgi:hypothetical protein